MDSSQKQTEEWYRKYYEAKGKDRNDLLTNPGVLYQLLAFEASVVSALRRANLDRVSSTILDVGCGGGNSIARFLQYGFAPRNLRGKQFSLQNHGQSSTLAAHRCKQVTCLLAV